MTHALKNKNAVVMKNCMMAPPVDKDLRIVKKLIKKHGCALNVTA